MSDTIKGLTVSFKLGINQETAQEISDAISLIKGVAGVNILTEDPHHHIARMQVRAEIMTKFMEVFKSLD